MSSAEFPSVIGTTISLFGKGVEVFTNLVEVFIDGESIGTSRTPGEFQHVFDAIEFATQERLRLEELFAETGDLSIQAQIDALGFGIRDLLRTLPGAIKTKAAPSRLSTESIKAMSEVVLAPPPDPEKACLAPASLLQDLLDLGLTKAAALLDQVTGGISARFINALTPAFATGESLTRTIQAILADPVTAAFNLVLGTGRKVDCQVTAHKDVGEGAIEMAFKRLVGFVDKVLA